MESLKRSTGASPARVLMPTLRRINPHAAWCANYEFEDVIRAVDDVQLLELEQGEWFAPRHRIARSLAWHGRHPAFTGMNPGLKPVVVDRDYDLFVFVCMNVWDLLYLNAIHDWQSRCRVKVCYMAEFYSGQASQYDQFLRTLSRFDHVLQSFSGSVPAVTRVIGKPCHHVPFAADVRALHALPQATATRHRRVQHRRPLRSPCTRRSCSWRPPVTCSTCTTRSHPPWCSPRARTQHRDLLANCAKRSRFFVTYEAKFGNSENQGQSEVGARYFEGTAAGAVLLGRAPTVPSFREDFPWPDPVVEVKVDGSRCGGRARQPRDQTGGVGAPWRAERHPRAPAARLGTSLEIDPGNRGRGPATGLGEASRGAGDLGRWSPNVEELREARSLRWGGRLHRSARKRHCYAAAKRKRRAQS